MTLTTPRTESDRAAKLELLRALLDARGASAISLTSAESLAWLFDGARVTVPFGGPPVLTATVDRDGVTVHALANEVDRLVAEELGDTGELLVRPVPWHAPLPIDPLALPEPDAIRELRALRARLLPGERARYARLGAEAASAVTRVAKDSRPTDSERAVAARLAAAMVGIGADPLVLLVAGESRATVPHPLPTDRELGRRAMLVVGARRHGLFANLTRWVAFGRDDGADTDARLREVEADVLEATRPGRRLADVLEDAAAAYPRHGFAAGAWLGHHQGGPTGYAGRDPKATPATDDLVVSGQAFAWNPSVPGAKVEDTVIVDDAGVTVLTADPHWPAVPVRGIPRPTTLVLD